MVVLVAKSLLTLATPWTAAYPDPRYMGFSRQEYWSGLPFPSPGDLPTPGLEPGSPTLLADYIPTELWGNPNIYYYIQNRESSKNKVLMYSTGNYSQYLIITNNEENLQKNIQLSICVSIYWIALLYTWNIGNQL